MHTVTIEILRTGTSHNYNLSGDWKYIALCGTHPPINFSIDCDQLRFNNHIKLLRYDNTDENSRKTGIKFFQDLLTGVLDEIKPLREEANSNKNDEWLHLRLVMTPKELAQLPFELALTPDGFQGQHSIPFLLNPDIQTTLTREIRQVNNSRYLWPHRPRILFAWANPNEAVPKDEHLKALVETLKPLAIPIKDNAEPIPDLATLLTPLGKASLKSIHEAIDAAIAKNNPYTHIHILAHGVKVTDINGEEFKLVLHDDDDINKSRYASGKELVKAIEGAKKETIDGVEKVRAVFPAVVSLMTCDSSNAGSMILPSGSLAHELHESGIPCVFASQFPLSTEGSVKLVTTLYKKLLIEGDDPRKALYFTREAINDNKVHDWASLAAHVRFPEDIDKQLEDAKLKVLFASMKTTNNWTDHVFKYREKIKSEKIAQIFKDIESRLEKSINGLLECYKEGCSVLATPELRAEHLGLLGSAYKRKAEHLFRTIELDPAEELNLIKQSSEELSTAKDFYHKGFEALASSHWNAMQYLSLKAVLDGSLQNESAIWTIIQFMAEKDEQSAKTRKDRSWSWGTLAELYMLKPLTVPGNLFENELVTSLLKAKEYVSKIKQSQEVDVIDSTIRQFDRYISWWPKMISSPQMKELKKFAIEIRNVFAN